MTDSEKLSSLMDLVQRLSDTTVNGFSKLENQQLSIEGRLVSLETQQISIEGRLVSLETQQISIEGRLVSLETQQMSIEGRLVSLEKQQGSIEGRLLSKLNGIQGTLNEFRGDMNERVLRKAAEKKYGEPFSKSFNIQGLEGLAHLIFPSKREGQGYSPRPENSVKAVEKSQHQMIAYRMKKLISFVYQQKQKVNEMLLRDACLSVEDVFGPGLRGGNRSRVQSLTITAQSKRVQMICHFALSDKSQKENLWRQDNGLGVIFFTAACGIEPLHEIELEGRGDIQVVGREVIIRMMEIKSNRQELGRAVERATNVLYVLETVLRQFLPETTAIMKQCIVVLPLSQRDASKSPPQTAGVHLVVEYL